MLTLYYKPSCPFTRRVIAVIDRLELPVELKDINDENMKAELVARCGNSQIPYLVDPNKEVEMADSDAIVVHLQTNYGKQSSTLARPRISISDNVCVSCEG